MMTERENQLCREEVGGAQPRLCLRSRTRIDTGLWLRRSPLCLCLVGDRLVMLAVGRRRYAASVLVSECSESHYCQATGELVVQPGESLRHKRFKLSPRQALRLLAEMKQTTSREGQLRAAAP